MNLLCAALKDIRHLNRPPSHCRQSLFPGFPVHHHHHHHHNQHAKGDLSQSRQEQLQKQDQHGQSQLQPAPHNSQAFDLQSESMKREALESRLENENAYIDHMDLSLAAAAAAAAAAHHHNAAGLHHPNSRHHEMENNLHKGTYDLSLFV